MGKVVLKKHFRTETITFRKENAEHILEVSQWCAAGALLVSLEKRSDVSLGKKESKADISLYPGSGTEFSADRKAILAVEPGYPRIISKEEDSGNMITVEIKPMLQIKEDGWMAKLTLYPPVVGTDLPDEQEIIRLLQEAGVRWGIREKIIKNALDTVCIEGSPVVDQVVAKGRLPVNGQNGKLRMQVSLDVRPGKVQTDGSMDYRERNMFVGVEKDQLLAQRISATAGLAGMNIFGHEVPQIPGKELTLKSTPDIIFDEVTGEIRAAFAGVVSVVGDSQIKVTSKQVITEDVDYSTGNVSSKFAIEIGGSIRPGFNVKAEGDILVKGKIESAAVYAGANVVIGVGIIGKKSRIESKGDVETPFIEEGSILSQGGVTIGEEAYFATIHSKKNITCGTDSKVVGSELIAGGSLVLNQVDTQSSSHSFLAAAVDIKRYAHYQKLLSKIAQCEKEFAQLQHRLGPGIGSSELDDLSEELDEYRAACQGYSLVPDVPENDKSGGLRYACIQQISLTGTVEAGAVLRIANIEVRLKQALRDGCFSLHSEKEQIIFQSKTSKTGTIFL